MRVRQTPKIKGLPSVEQFHAILERERARSDRTGDSFSLVVFETRDKDHDPDAVHLLVDVLSGRLRLTDEAGWFNGHDIGVALPNTPAGSAKKLADDICRTISRNHSPPGYTIYTYPSNWLSGSEENFPDQSSEETDSGEDTSSAKQLEKTGIYDNGNHANRIEMLLGHPLPAWKRGIDILGSVSGILLLFPLFLLIAFLIKTVSPGPVFFNQQRIGYQGKPFTFWKFRTMKVDADPTEHLEHISKMVDEEKPWTKLDDNDDRIIPFGKILRKTGLDELPQLYNILRGDMSLVGPRPDLPYSVNCYHQWQLQRLDTIPGLTGLWQVNGKNENNFKEMIRFDINYVRQKSLWIDTKIIMKTVPSILKQLSVRT